MFIRGCSSALSCLPEFQIGSWLPQLPSLFPFALSRLSVSPDAPSFHEFLSSDSPPLPDYSFPRLHPILFRHRLGPEVQQAQGQGVGVEIGRIDLERNLSVERCASGQ